MATDELRLLVFDRLECAAVLAAVRAVAGSAPGGVPEPLANALDKLEDAPTIFDAAEIGLSAIRGGSLYRRSDSGFVPVSTRAIVTGSLLRIAERQEGIA